MLLLKKKREKRRMGKVKNGGWAREKTVDGQG